MVVVLIAGVSESFKQPQCGFHAESFNLEDISVTNTRGFCRTDVVPRHPSGGAVGIAQRIFPETPSDDGVNRNLGQETPDFFLEAVFGLGSRSTLRI